jgi:hypothetical protein
MNPRPQDIMYEIAMRCGKSPENKHHFAPLKVDRKDTQELSCSHCGVIYEAVIHNPPVGYQPTKTVPPEVPPNI